ncbi:MAG: PIN domain-containing protein [Phycisphaerales bacterium]|nr:MAG: PIN domain-containing protein [Phycisphaerales bacterium]
MAQYFLDSSALVKRYILEDGTPRVVGLVRGSDALAVSRITKVEVTSTLVRRSRGGDLDPATLDRLLEAMEREFRTRFEIQPLNDSTLSRSVKLARSHELRAADAIQLASAVQCADTIGDQAALTLVSSDRELNAAAGREGLIVLDPRDDGTGAES